MTRPDPAAVMEGRYMAVRAADRAAPDLIVNTVGRCTVAVSPADVSHEVAGALNLAACWLTEAMRLLALLPGPPQDLLQYLLDLAADGHGDVASFPPTMDAVLAALADYSADTWADADVRDALDELAAAGWIEPWAEREGDEVVLTMLARTLRWNA